MDERQPTPARSKSISDDFLPQIISKCTLSAARCFGVLYFRGMRVSGTCGTTVEEQHWQRFEVWG